MVKGLGYIFWDKAAWSIKSLKWNGRTNSGHIYKQRNGPESSKWQLSNATKNTKIEQEMDVKTMKLSPHVPLPQGSKTRNEIVQPILATFTHWNMVLKAMNHSFKIHLRTPQLSRKWLQKSWNSLPISSCLTHQNSQTKFQDKYSMDF